MTQPAAATRCGLDSAARSRMAISVHRETLDDEPLVRSSRIPDAALAALRIVAGLMFMQHGAQKFFGLFAAPGMPAFQGPPELFSQMWFAGALELVGGFILAIGLLTRVVAFVLSGEMAWAYFQAHAPNALFPAANGGELAVLYCFVFLAFAALGGGPYSVDGIISRSRGRPIERPYSASRWRRRKARAKPEVVSNI
jgi:putative oxidoreductase